MAPNFALQTKAEQNQANESIKLAESSTSKNSNQTCSEQTKAFVEPNKHINSQKKCATGVLSDFPKMDENDFPKLGSTELAEISAAWPHLSEPIKAGILAMIRAATR